MGFYFFLILDSHSKWIEVKKVTNTAANPVIQAQQQIFATHGTPDRHITVEYGDLGHRNLNMADMENSMSGRRLLRSPAGGGASL